MNTWISEIINEKKLLLNNLEDYISDVEYIGLILSECILNGNKIILAGNGGSAADAGHFAGELLGRFLQERKSLPAISLCTDPSVVTCISNDYGFDEIFARQLSGIGKLNDCFIGFSTSGNSKNLINAVNIAKKMKIISIGLLGNDGGELKNICNYSLVVPSKSTPRIQEIHTFTVHLLCQIIEKKCIK